MVRGGAPAGPARLPPGQPDDRCRRQVRRRRAHPAPRRVRHHCVAPRDVARLARARGVDSPRGAPQAAPRDHRRQARRQDPCGLHGGSGGGDPPGARGCVPGRLPDRADHAGGAPDGGPERRAPPTEVHALLSQAPGRSRVPPVRGGFDAMVKIRKLVTVVEEILTDGGRAARRPVRKVAAVAVIENPFAGKFVEDLTPLVDAGEELGALLAKKATEALGAPAESYGKAAVVGEAGEYEHAAALLHPKLGAPLRAAVGGGKAIIPSAKKLGGPGTTIDVPLHFKDAAFVRTHYDAMEVRLNDAPRANEILLTIVVTDGGRRPLDPQHQRRLARGRLRAHGRALQGARAAHERGDRGGARAVGGRRRHLPGQVLSLRAPDRRSQARPEAAPAHLDRRRHATLGEALR